MDTTNNVVSQGVSLEKGEKVNVTKGNEGLSIVNFAAGWNPESNAVDLDLSALALDANNKWATGNLTTSLLYFRNRDKNPIQGLQHSGDNTSGEGEGDDETITVNLSQVPANIQRILFFTNIWEAQAKGQFFSKVKDAYCRAYDGSSTANKNDQSKQLLRFDISEDGGRNTGVIFGALYRRGTDWSFEAMGEFVAGDINQICATYKP